MGHKKNAFHYLGYFLSATLTSMYNAKRVFHACPVPTMEK